MLGETIGHYRITAKLGEGGMGAVYRATDTKLNREVAIKVLPDTFAADPDRLARFTREAQVLASLNHPNIATIFGVEDKALVMELVEGNDLSGPLPLTEALQIARQIAEGLEAAHDKGIIHRDLKPANIKVTPDGIVKVLDFGLAKATDSAATATSADSPTMTIRATQAGLIMGTAGYMSPEQAAGKTVDKRADIWAFGVVLHELLTGKKLFHGETVSHTLAAVLRDQVDFAITQAPKPIQALLARCLDRNLKHRLKDIGEARIAIEDYLANPKAQQPVQPTTSRPILWIGLSAALLLALISTITLWLRTPKPQARAIHFNLGQEFSLESTGTNLAPRISPDGNWLVGQKGTEGGALYVRRLDDSNWRKLPGTEAALFFSVFWAEDSSAIGFVSAGRLRIMAIENASPRDLIEVQAFRGASWRGGRDSGTILLATGGKLMVLDPRAAAVRDLPLQFSPGKPPAEPVFLPKGDGFVFLLNQGKGQRLFRSALNSTTIDPYLPTRRRVSFATHPTTGKWHIFYLADTDEVEIESGLVTAPVDPNTGSLLADPVKLLQGVARIPTQASFSVGTGGLVSWNYALSVLPIWRLTWSDRSGKVLDRIAENRSIVSIALSPDESKIAVCMLDPAMHIWIFDSKTGAGNRISSSPNMERQAFWAPDGKSIFFQSSSSTVVAIRRHFLGSTQNEEVVWQSNALEDRSLMSPAPIGLSEDGRYLFANRRGQIAGLNLQAAPPAKWEPFKELEPGLGSPALSPDSRLLAIPYGLEGIEIQDFPPTAQPAKRFKHGTDQLNSLFFSQDARNLYAHSAGNLVALPVSRDGSIGEPKVLFPWLTHLRFGSNLAAASRDGNRFLLVDTDKKDNLYPQVLTDWTTLLPK